MAIPKYDELMLPLLEVLKDGKETLTRDAAKLLVDRFRLTEEERSALLPRVNVTYILHRTGWAGFHLGKAGLIDRPRRGVLRINEAGRRVLAEKPEAINRKYLMRFPSFANYMRELRETAEPKAVDPKGGEEVLPGQATPDEIMETAYESIRAGLATELLDTIKQCSPLFFEKLVVDLLLKMGYGGSRLEAGRATKPTGDNGIDGIIKEDRLGLDAIYIQAKRWENPVGERELRDFAGALAGEKARKGVFITTSHFTEHAKSFVRKIESKIVLIDGNELANFMIDHGVGVSLASTYEIKKIDTDYFEEDAH